MANHPAPSDDPDTAATRRSGETTHPSRAPTDDEPDPVRPPAADPPGDADGNRYEPL